MPQRLAPFKQVEAFYLNRATFHLCFSNFYLKMIKKSLGLTLTLLLSVIFSFASDEMKMNSNGSMESIKSDYHEVSASIANPAFDQACATVTLSCGWSQYKCAESVVALIIWSLAADVAICGGEVGEPQD